MIPSLTRRMTLSGLAASALLPSAMPALAKEQPAKEITWDDLIPPGVPYSEIIGEGEMDLMKDTWDPIYDENATKLNETLNGAFIRMPGFVIPLEYDATGVSGFLLAPYMGACIHVPPPPSNQLVLVETKTPWPSEELWAPVWVIGTMRTQLQSTELGQTGYFITADRMEEYNWE